MCRIQANPNYRKRIIRIEMKNTIRFKNELFQNLSLFVYFFLGLSLFSFSDFQGLQPALHGNNIVGRYLNVLKGKRSPS